MCFIAKTIFINMWVLLYKYMLVYIYSFLRFN
nr:ALPV-162 [Albatrosspox virus]